MSLVLAAAMGAMAFGAEAPAAAHARMQASQLAAEVRSYAIPAGTVGMALNRLAEENGVQMVFLAGLTRNAKTGGLKGEYTLGAALDELLAGTGLGYRLADDEREVFIVLAQNGVVRSDAGAEALPPIDVGAEAQSRSASRAAGSSRPSAPKAPDVGYVVHNASAGTKTDTPILQSPMAVQIIPRAVIEDQKVSRVQEALENVSGVRPNQSIGSGTGFFVRGFGDSRKMFRNGLLATSPSSFRSDFEAANVERIEVLKGPAAMLYGRMEPGGLINIVTKRPSDVAYRMVEQRIGSYGQYRTVWDATGPIKEDGSILYRFSGAYENSNSFVDTRHLDRVILDPSITFRPTLDTDFTVDLEYFDQDYGISAGIPAIGNRPAPIPVTRFLGDPNEPQANIRKFHLNSELAHRFDENWTFRNRFLASFVHTDDVTFRRAPTLAVPPGSVDDGVLKRNILAQISDAEVYATNLDLLGKFDLLGMRHETLVGFDYLRAETEYSINGNSRTPDRAFDINIFYPWASYGVPRSAFDAAMLDAPSPSRVRNVFYEDQKGAYFQDHITILDQLHIFGGGRYDWAEVARGTGRTVDEARTSLSLSSPSIIRKDEAFTPRVGVLFQPMSWASVYGSWTTGFAANNGVDSSNNPHPSQQSEQFELGIKGELFDHRLMATISFYNLTRTNLLTRDLSNPDPLATKTIGEQRSKGVEFDAVGKVTDSLSLISSFTYMDARITKDNTLNATGTGFDVLGRRLANIPRYFGSLWFKWDVKEIEELDGFSLGFGAYVVGNRQGNNQGTFQLPGYVRLDAMAAYSWIGWWGVKTTAQLNIRNLTNARYFEGTDLNSNNPPQLSIYPGAPFTAIGSIKVEF